MPPDFSFELTSDADGEIIDGDDVPDSELIKRLVHGERAAEQRRRAISDGERVSYVVEADDQAFVVSVAAVAETEDSGRLAYSISQKDEPPEQELEADSSGILDVLPDAVVMTDLEGRILYANQAAIDLVGADDISQVRARFIWELVHPEERLSARREGWLATGGKTVEYVRHRVVRFDGHSIPVETVTRKTNFRGKPAILISAHDMTGLHTMEQALAETQQLFYNAFETGPLGISISKVSDGRLVDVNPSFCRLVGVPRGELVGQTLSEAGVGYDSSVVADMRQGVERRGSVAEVELEIRTPGGDRKSLLCSASLIDVTGEACMLTMSADITERKRATSALKESEERFRAMADNAPVLIWIAAPDKNCVYFNARWLEFTGRTLEQEYGDGWAEGVHPDDLERCLYVYSSSFDRRESFSMEYRLRRDDGVYRWLLDRGVPRYLPDGTFIGYIGSCVDITDRKLAEQKLIQSKQQAEEVTILKSAFLTNMTHEIRTPLTVILGFTSILRQGVRKEYHRFVNLIERSGRRLLLMLDSVLDLAQLEAGTLKIQLGRHNVADIAHGIFTTLVPIAEEKGVRFTMEEPQEVPYAQVDPGVLSRVLNNLMDNALKFTEKGSIVLSFSKEDRGIGIHIRDTGIGIDEAFLPKIFDAFSQESTGIERTHQGSGLGLTVSKQLLELTGGALTVESAKGVGSRVTVWLPHA